VPIHIEILLPSFCLGMITDEHEDEEELKHEYTVKDLKDERKMSVLREGINEDEELQTFTVKDLPVQKQYNNKVHPKDEEFEDDNGEKEETLTTEEMVQFYISALFMLLIGLSMPSIVKTPEETTHRALMDM